MLDSTSSEAIDLTTPALSPDSGRIKVQDNGLDLKIEIPWGYQISTKVAFSIVALSVSFAGIITLLSSQYLGALLGGQKILMYPFIGGLWLGEFVLAWILLARALNKTILHAKSDRLLFWDDPISIGRVKVLKMSELSGFSLERPTSLEEQNKKRRTGVHHFVCAHLRGGDKVLRLCEVKDVREGVWVQHLLEKKLGFSSSSSAETSDIS